MSTNLFEPDIKAEFDRRLSQGHFTHGTFDEIVGKLRPLLTALPPKDYEEISKELEKDSQQIDKSKLLCFLNDLQAGKYSPFLTYDLEKSRIRNRVAIDDQIVAMDDKIVAMDTQIVAIDTQIKEVEDKDLQKKRRFQESRERFQKSRERFQALKAARFSSFQRIKAGGDCYYRAIMKGYIEQSIMEREAPEKRTFFFNRLANLFEGEVLAKQPVRDVERPQISALIANLRAAANGEKWTTLQEFWKDLANEKTGTDHYLILSSRYLVAQALENNPALVQALYLQTDVIERIRQMGEYAEGHPNISLLPKILAFPCDLIFIADNVSIAYRELEYIPSEYTENPPIHTFSHENQYCILYNSEDQHYDAIIHGDLERRMMAFEGSAPMPAIANTLEADNTNDNPCCFFLFFIYAWEFLKWIINCLTGNNTPTNADQNQPLIDKRNP